MNSPLSNSPGHLLNDTTGIHDDSQWAYMVTARHQLPRMITSLSESDIRHCFPFYRVISRIGRSRIRHRTTAPLFGSAFFVRVSDHAKLMEMVARRDCPPCRIGTLGGRVMIASGEELVAMLDKLNGDRAFELSPANNMKKGDSVILTDPLFNGITFRFIEQVGFHIRVQASEANHTLLVSPKQVRAV